MCADECYAFLYSLSKQKLCGYCNLKPPAVLSQQYCPCSRNFTSHLLWCRCCRFTPSFFSTCFRAVVLHPLMVGSKHTARSFHWAELSCLCFPNLTLSAERTRIQSARICRGADHSTAEAKSVLYCLKHTICFPFCGALFSYSGVVHKYNDLFLQIDREAHSSFCYW